MTDPLDALFAAARSQPMHEPVDGTPDEQFAWALRQRIAGDRAIRLENRTLTRGLAAMVAVVLASLAYTQTRRPQPADPAAFIVPEAALDFVFVPAATATPPLPGLPARRP